MSSILDRIYSFSPLFIQNLGISLYGLIWENRRFGGNFNVYQDQFINREKFSKEEWDIYQNVQLLHLLQYAIKYVPYYKEILGPKSGKALNGFTLDNLQTIPLLSKDLLRTHPEYFISQDSSKDKMFQYSTSGTTGTPLTIYYTQDMHRNWSAAYDVRVRGWAGVNHRMSRAMIGGRLVVPKANSKPPFWRYNFAERQLYMSAFHISPTNASEYVKALNKYKPDYLVGYASSHFFLARMIVEQKLSVYQPKAVLTSSEKLTSIMRETIENAYHCHVFDAYSGVEACCLTSECEHHRMHVSPDVGIIELLDENGIQVKPGIPGEIVATGLLNFEQPLIRYRTGDLAVWSEEPCPCGRQMPVIKELIGRIEDTVIGPDGREAVRFHGIFVGLPHIIEGQVIQETLSNFRLRLVVQDNFNDLDRKVLQERFNQRLGPIDLKIELVDEIERTERGKFKAVISKVNRENGI